MAAGYRSPFMSWLGGVGAPVPPAVQAGMAAFWWLASGMKIGATPAPPAAVTGQHCQYQPIQVIGRLGTR